MIQKISSLAILAILLLSANVAFSQSVKGNWSNKDMAKAREEINSIRGEVQESMGDDTDEYLDCYLQKVVNKYSNFEEADNDVDGCTKLAEKCLKELGANSSEKQSKKGNWNQTDIQRANAEVNAMRSEVHEMMGEDTDAYLACYLTKIEAHYKNFDKANADLKGCTKLATDCVSEF